MTSMLRQILALALLGLVLGGCASNQHLQTRETMRPAPVETPDSPEKVDRLWQVFERYRGTPYEYGGTSAQGFDCSGFIITAYREGLGQQLPRTTAQMLRHGREVPPDQVKPGDLVFFRIGGKERHAGIYMGDNRFIHASTSIGVTLSELNGYYWADRFTEARRFEGN
ncbi:NlpC/P60 family protein [Marinobacter pelagius]|uniref:C40 family peptidase n=1 Tax=Marinobacter sp. C7 TaxID=2951363 RepID=UPI001EEFE6C2|nr:NlpC/P60 family protein [Marinobacter sp. C7]MCG7201239.1 NlpC/P60 family protein [Marinobacter sp. C7]